MHAHEHAGVRSRQSKVLWWSLAANAALMVAEIVGGLVFGSLALLADAAHMASDVGALSVALVAHRLMGRPHSAKHTYGLQRAEVVGALANSLLLMGLSVWIVVAAIGRFGRPGDVEGGGLLVVASLGLMVNLVCAYALRRAAAESLNLRGAYLHMMMDALGSVGAITAGVAVVVWDATWTDPAVSLAIAALVVWSSWSLLREALHVLLEGTPRGLDPEEIRRSLLSDASVEDVHHVHVWNIASDTRALSAHVVLRSDMSLHDAQLQGERLKARLAERFHIQHSTLEFECHACDPAP